jgi:hypothetical protein
VGAAVHFVTYPKKTTEALPIFTFTPPVSRLRREGGHFVVGVGGGGRIF